MAALRRRDPSSDSSRSSRRRRSPRRWTRSWSHAPAARWPQRP